MKKSILGLIILSAMTTSCVDDYFEPAQESKYMDKIGYKVNLTAGDDFKSRSAGSHDNRIVTIDPIDATIGGKQLYLHTTIDNEFPVVDKSQKAQSRGVEINDGDLDAIKVSAVVYDGEWGADEGFDPKPYMDNELSEAPAWSTNRYWPRESDRIRFYAYAPQNVLAAGPDDIDGLPSGASIPSFEYKVNDEVKNQQDLLVASADYAGNLCTVAHLEFGHALTAVNIQIAKSVADFELTGLVISGLKNQGTYTYNWEDGAMENDKWIEGSNGDSDTISSTHDKGGWTDLDGSASYTLFPRPVGAEQTQVTSLELTGNTDSDVVFTDGNMLLLMMPQELGEDAKITVTGRDKILNKDVTLSANIGGEGQEWEAGKRVTYTLSFSSTRINYYLEVGVSGNVGIPYYGIKDQSYSVKSYKVITRSGLDDIPVAVPWQAVAVVNGSEVAIPAGLLLSAINGSGVENASLTENYTYCLLPNLGSTDSKSHKNFLTAGYTSLVPIRGTKDNPYDLSTNEDYSPSQGPKNTANSYMIFAPGYYTLPLVYGNAIAGGNTNSSSYIGYSGSYNQNLKMTDYNGNENGVTVSVPCMGLANFKDHADKAITGPWIVNTNSRGGKYAPAKAEIVWQDEPCLVTEVKLNETKDYINFRVHEETVCDGNAVIAVKDASGDIMWSWHIWVNDGHAYHNQSNVVGGDEAFEQSYISPGDKNFDVSLKITNRRVTSSNWTDCTWEGSNTADTYTGAEFTMSRVFLGHCDGETKNYKARDIIIRFKQVEADDVEFKGEAKTSDVTFSQLSGTVSTVNNIPYYQYGRKDPMLPTGEKGKDKIYYDNDWNIQNGGIKKELNQVKIYEAIKHPDVFYAQSSRSISNNLRNYNWCSEGTFMNLWNTNSRSVPAFAYHSNFGGSNRYKFHAEFNDLISCGVTKSVYDPCPPGFEMPRVDAFTGASFHGMNVYPLWYDGRVYTSDFAFSFNSENSNSYAGMYDEFGFHIYGNVWLNPWGNPYYVCFENFNAISIYATPMAKAGERGLFEDQWGGETLPIPFFGYRNAEGTLEKYGEFANALTSAPICTQNMVNTNNSMEGNAQYMLVRFCVIKSKDAVHNTTTMIPYSLRVCSGSDFDLAFGIIPARTGYNPSTIGINAEPGWSDGNDHNYNIDF